MKSILATLLEKMGLTTISEVDELHAIILERDDIIETISDERDYRDSCIKSLQDNLKQSRVVALEQSNLAVQHLAHEAEQKKRFDSQLLKGQKGEKAAEQEIQNCHDDITYLHTEIKRYEETVDEYILLTQDKGREELDKRHLIEALQGQLKLRDIALDQYEEAFQEHKVRYQLDGDTIRNKNIVIAKLEHDHQELKTAWIQREQALVTSLNLRTTWHQAAIERETVLNERLDDLQTTHAIVLESTDKLTAKFNYLVDTLQTVTEND